MNRENTDRKVIYVEMFGQFAGMLNVPPLNDDSFGYNYISDYIVCAWGFFDTSEYVSLYPGNCMSQSLSFGILRPDLVNWYQGREEDKDADRFVVLSKLKLTTAYVSCYNELLNAYKNTDARDVWVFPLLKEIKKLNGFEDVPDDDLFFCR